MYLEGIEAAQTLSLAAMATMQQYEIPVTPDNYALWFEYHAGYSSKLQRTIDVILSNRVTLDEKILRDLHKTFFSSANEEQAIRQTSLQVQETLRDIIAVADRARSDTREFGAALTDVTSGDLGKGIESLQALIQRLIAETQRMAGRNEIVGLSMRESISKIESLERNLEQSIRDASIDDLTGLANRKTFDLTVRKMAGDAMNSGEELALLMIDIDHFKSVNDTWGHQVGDQVLRYTAEKLQESVRGQDFVARYGGEEFSIILPRTCMEAGVKVGHNIRESLVRAPIGLEVLPPIRPVTVSVGVACYIAGDPLADWVKRTDAALYRAKRDGRNCVRFCDQEGL